MICHSHKFIEIHVPRTGGTSRKEALKKQGCTTAGDRFDHCTAYEIQQVIGPVNFDDYYKYSFRRNPCELMVSLFHYWRDVHFHDGNPHRIEKDITFEEWAKPFLKELPRGKVKELSSHSHYWNNAKGIDLFRFENMGEAWKEIQNRIGVRAPLERLNASGANSKDWREFFDGELFLMLKARFDRDISLYGWPTEWEL